MVLEKDAFVLNLNKRGKAYLYFAVAISSAALGTIWLYSQGWRSNLIHCYFQDAFGIIGPGCGLTRSLIALMNGQWQESISYHAFGSIIFLSLAGLLAFSLVSLVSTKSLIPSLTRKYQALLVTGFAVSFSAAFMAYYALRVIARYYSSALPSFFTASDIWQFIVSSSNLI